MVDKENLPDTGNHGLGLKRGSLESSKDVLPAAFDIASDSPVCKKARPSDARKSRVSFGGVEMRTFCKPSKHSARQSPRLKAAPVQHESPDSSASGAEVFFSPRSQQSGSPSDLGEFDAETPRLQDLLAAEDTAGLLPQQQLADDNGVTKPIPRLSELGNFDDTLAIDTRAVSLGDDFNPSTAFIAAEVAQRPSMAFDEDTATAPSLAELMQRFTQGGSCSESESLEDSMEMTGCYGGIMVGAQSPAVDGPSIGTKIPHSNTPATETSDVSSSNAGAGASPIITDPHHPAAAKLSLTPQLKELMTRKVVAAENAPSPISSDVNISPALMRAGSRLTLTPSKGDAELVPMRSLELDGGNRVVSSDSADITEQNGDEEHEEVATTLNMPDSIPERPLPSPIQVHKGPMRHSSTGGAVLKSMIRRSSANGANLPEMVRRSSMAPQVGASSLLSLPEDAEPTRIANYAQFCAVADIRFLDDLSTNRRTTMMCRQPSQRVSTLKECTALMTTELPKLRAMQQGCDNITTMVVETQKKIADAEVSAELSPPLLFQKLAADTRSEACTLMRGILATLKRNCRKEAKLEWYTWYKDAMNSMADQATTEVEQLLTDTSAMVNRAAQYDAGEEKMSKYMRGIGVQPLDGRQPVRTEEDMLEVQALEKSVEQRARAVDELQQIVATSSKCVLALESRNSNLQSSNHAIDSEAQSFVSRAQIAGTATLVSANEACDRYTMVLDIEGVTIRKLSYGEIILDLCKKHRIHLMCDGDVVTETKLQLFETVGCTVDELHRGLVEDAELDCLVAQLCGRSMKLIPQTLNELNFRLGRCDDLIAEVDSVQRILKLLVSRTRGCVEVTVANFIRNRKVKIQFSELNYGFPFGDMNVEIVHHVGDMNAEALMETIREQRTGQYGRLFNICQVISDKLRD